MTTPTDTEKLAQALREVQQEMQRTKLLQIEAMGDERTAALIRKWSATLAGALAAHEYRAQPASVAGGWQPMETAPKGGGAERTDDPAYIEPPRILIRFGDEAVSVAYWDWYYAEGGRGFTDGFAWIEPCSGEPLNLHYTTPPDGWMSLAAAPQPAKESE